MANKARAIAAASVSMWPASPAGLDCPDRMPPTTSATMYPEINTRAIIRLRLLILSYVEGRGERPH
jgi:hypothetical protein